MIITRESIESDGNLKIPVKHVNLLECKDVADFINRNFAIRDFDGVECLICAPENGIALCELFYEKIFKGYLLNLVKSEDYYGSDGIYRWSEETDKNDIEFKDYDVFLEICDHDRSAQLMDLLIERGCIMRVNRGDKIGPYMGTSYFNNDYYVVRNYKDYIQNGLCLDNDAEAEKRLKRDFYEYYLDFQFPFVLFLERERFPEMINAGLFDNMNIDWITETFSMLSSEPHTPVIELK